VGEIRLYRDGLAIVLGRSQQFEVVGSVAYDIEAIEATHRLCPDVVLLDIALGGNGDTLDKIHEFAAAARVIALGVAEAEPDIIRCAEAGVAGYVSREGSVETLINTIECVVRGEMVCSPQIAGSMLRRIASLSAGRRLEAAEALTSREREILRLIEDGSSNKEIAGRLGIEISTVKNHVHNLLEKLHVHRRAEAAARLRGRMPKRSALPQTFLARD
jgi:DNA-binding NarL/FixJ family response regulator